MQGLFQGFLATGPQFWDLSSQSWGWSPVLQYSLLCSPFHLLFSMFSSEASSHSFINEIRRRKNGRLRKERGCCCFCQVVTFQKFFVPEMGARAMRKHAFFPGGCLLLAGYEGNRGGAADRLQFRENGTLKEHVHVGEGHQSLCGVVRALLGLLGDEGVERLLSSWVRPPPEHADVLLEVGVEEEVE